MDEKLTIAPLPALTMGRRKIWVGMTVPVRLRSRTFWKASIWRSKKLPSGEITAPAMLPPAALRRASIRPYFSRIASQLAWTIWGFMTSVMRKVASPPWALMALTISSPSSCRRPRITIFAPWRARYSPMQRPRTPVPPVMTTTWSLTEKSSFIVVFSICVWGGLVLLLLLDCCHDSGDDAEGEHSAVE